MKKNTSIEIREIPFIALFAALTAISGYINIPLPFSPVPITAQTLAVMLAGSVLKPKSACLSMITFLILGIIGLPIFSGGSCGISAIIGPTGGYLISWPIAALITALIIRRFKPNFLNIFITNIFSGILIVYIIGTVHLSVVANLDLKTALFVGALPFIPGDILKAALSSTIAVALRKALH
jgi:biotin transport system substrate-specific component